MELVRNSACTFLVNYSHSYLDLSLYDSGLLVLIYQFGMSYLH